VCPPMDTFDQYVRAGLELQGFEVSEVDVQIIRAADAAYGPDMKALREADLREVWPETDLDPSRPPRGPEGPTLE
jgi:hypothetical protein